MRFSAVVQGTRARDRVLLPLGGKQIELDIRVLAPFEEAAVLEYATKFARERGLTEPVPEDELYEYGRQIATLLHACVDRDSPEAKPEPFFDSAEQILQSVELSRETVAYLFARAVMWAEVNSVRSLRLTDVQFIELLKSSVGGDFAPFCALRPGTQWSCFRSLAGLCLSLPAIKSTPGASSPDSTSTTAVQ